VRYEGDKMVWGEGLVECYEGDKMVWGEGLVECYEGDKMVVLFDAVGYKALAVDVVTQNGLLQAAGGR
jgi:hypothetical protein